MALDCQAKHAFAYTGHLTDGDALIPKTTAPRLSAGRAWGAAVAAWHSTDLSQLLSPEQQAFAALDGALHDDATEQLRNGTYDEAAHEALHEELLAVFMHYTQTTERWSLDPVLERKLLVALPSRSSERKSSRYKLIAYLDGTKGDWLVEFKYRSTLTPATIVVLSRQIRWYAWAYWQATGRKPVGVEVHERLAEAPKAPRLVQGRKKSEGKVPSHAKDQTCTVEAYEALCADYGVSPRAETVEALRARRWQQTVPVLFRDGELEEAGRELVSAAQQIHLLDSGRVMPLRNAKRHCNWCQFREICPTPDPELVDALHRRVPAKRNRKDEATDATGNEAQTDQADGRQTALV